MYVKLQDQGLQVRTEKSIFASLFTNVTDQWRLQTVINQVGWLLTLNSDELLNGKKKRWVQKVFRTIHSCFHAPYSERHVSCLFVLFIETLVLKVLSFIIGKYGFTHPFVLHQCLGIPIMDLDSIMLGAVLTQNEKKKPVPDLRSL